MLFFIFFISIAYAYNVEDDGLIKEEEVFPDLSYGEDENVNQINDINDLFNLFKYVRQVPDENDRRDFPEDVKNPNPIETPIDEINFQPFWRAQPNYINKYPGDNDLRKKRSVEKSRMKRESLKRNAGMIDYGLLAKLFFLHQNGKRSLEKYPEDLYEDFYKNGNEKK